MVLTNQSSIVRHICLAAFPCFFCSLPFLNRLKKPFAYSDHHNRLEFFESAETIRLFSSSAHSFLSGSAFIRSSQNWKLSLLSLLNTSGFASKISLGMGHCFASIGRPSSEQLFKYLTVKTKKRCYHTVNLVL